MVLLTPYSGILAHTQVNGCRNINRCTMSPSGMKSYLEPLYSMKKVFFLDKLKMYSNAPIMSFHKY